MTVCSCCGRFTAEPIAAPTLGRDRLVCSALCAAIVQALTIVNERLPA